MSSVSRTRKTPSLDGFEIARGQSHSSYPAHGVNPDSTSELQENAAQALCDRVPRSVLSATKNTDAMSTSDQAPRPPRATGYLVEEL
ncbi:hypothetical protein Plhal710r2_c015g0067491 [Plasmopara halstedii]